jgi:hypothetical protein
MRSVVLACTACSLVLVAGACGDSSPTVIDAQPGGDPGECLIAGDYGAVGSKTGAADSTGTPNSITITLAAAPPPDDLFLSLAAKGALAGGIAPGTYPIAGADASFNTCGLCVTILAHIDETMGPAKFFSADSGTVTISTVTPTAQSTPSEISGSAQDLHFVEVNIGTDGSSTPVAGGCTTRIGSITFGD